MKTYLPLVIVVFFFTSCSKDEKPVQYELSTSINPAQSGSISPSNGTFGSGENIRLTATAATGYVFKNWSGDASSSVNPLKLILDTDKNIIAVFEKPDNDNDGVSEEDDQCPNTSSGETVDENGCSESQKDTDGDGINDDVDECPDTGEREEVNATGCTTETDGAGGEIAEDSDGDRITDDVDQCPSTPEGETVNEQGCSNTQIDTDGDGVDNGSDDCPGTTEGENVDNNGCSESQSDSDNDGVVNDADECPNTPQGETVDDNGCTESQNDTDSDGISDDADECADTPEGETINEQGCSESQIDTDGDGVSNDKDECSETLAGETVDDQGCSESQKDADNDGITDDADECPETSESEDVDLTGCPLQLTTFVPDDEFERLLIDSGYDDVLDNQVLTGNMAAIEDLDFSSPNHEGIQDLTGFEALTSIKTLHFFGTSDRTFVLNTDNYPNLISISGDGLLINKAAENRRKKDVH